MGDGFDKRCGIGAGYRLALLPEFSVSDGGIGHFVEVFGECAEDLQRTQAWGVSLGFGAVDTTGKLLPDPVPASSINNRLLQGSLSWREGTRRFGDGPRTWYTRSDDELSVGFGTMTTTPQPQTVAGKTIQRPEESFTVMTLGNTSSAALVWEPTARFAIALRGGFGTYVLLPLGDAEHGHFSRNGILAFVGLEGAFVDNLSEKDSTNLASPSRIARGVVGKVHGFGKALVQHYQFSGASAKATNLLEQAHLVDTSTPSTNPETADLSFVVSLQSFMEGNDANLFFHSPHAGRWTLTGTDAGLSLGGFLAGANGKPGAAELYAGGFSSLFEFGAKLPWAIRIEDAPDGPLTNLPAPDTEFAVAATPPAVGMVLAVAIPAGTHQLSDGLGDGAFKALTARFADPDPMESGAVISKTYSTVSLGSKHISSNRNGSRGSAFKATRLRWMGGLLETRVSIATPYLNIVDGLQVLDVMSGQPEHLALPSTNRVEASAIVDIVKSTRGSLEFRAGLHLAQEHYQAATFNALGAQLALAGYVCMGDTGSFCLGTEVSAYGSIGHNGGTIEIPYPTLSLRFME